MSHIHFLGSLIPAPSRLLLPLATPLPPRALGRREEDDEAKGHEGEKGKNDPWPYLQGEGISDRRGNRGTQKMDN